MYERDKSRGRAVQGQATFEPSNDFRNVVDMAVADMLVECVAVGAVEQIVKEARVAGFHGQNLS